jgi:GRAM domain-containing protein
MQTKLESGEELLRSGRANLQRGVETVGGHLYLTPVRLIFESHRFNVRRGTTEIQLRDIEAVRPVWTRFLNAIPTFPNSIEIDTRSEGFRVVVGSRRRWMEAIEKARPGQ